MKKKLFAGAIVLFCALSSFATKLVSVQIVDKDYIMLYFRDGDVVFNERKIVDWQTWELYHNGPFLSNINSLKTYGTALQTSNAAIAGNWKISSNDDTNFGATGTSPSNVYRKSKLGCMAQMGWNNSANDFDYNWAYEHTIFLKLPHSLEQGKTYTIQIPADINSDITTHTITFDIFNSRSDAVKVNIVGYSTAESIKSADVYLTLGDGGARDYSSFAGKKIYTYNIVTKEKHEVGTLSLWKTAAGETDIGHQMLQSSVWKADFTGFSTAGTYRLAIEDIGCSEDFEIRSDIYFAPFKVATQGFYYMRIGEDSKKSGISPVARQPLYIPEVSPANCKVIITTMQPYHAQWSSFVGDGSDPWDNPNAWAQFAKAGNPTNPNAYGGHSDAMDWDRHLGHVSIIYDMLLPFYLSGGAISDDNLGIAESGNGIPDVLDEARNEVDFWLRLRDGKGYSHGVTCPTENNATFYQAGTTAVAAWANAANAALLANCFRFSAHTELMNEYRDSAINAYEYANSLSDKQLTRSQEMGDMTMTGNDLKITAAAFLYNLTGDVKYENDLLAGSRCTTNFSQVSVKNSSCELYALAGYVLSNQPIHNQARRDNMKNSIIAEAKTKEANYSNIRPSRRSTNEDAGWFVTSIHNQRTIVAHAMCESGSADKQFFENALILEADFSLGRNPLNAIHMTTATTELAQKKSFENAYTSGWNDGTEGVHPGHTPYMNAYDWGGHMIMGRPQWMVEKNYPAVQYINPSNPSNGIKSGSWAVGELYYNTRYVYAANEFTPQQTMRGKIALYAYLYSLGEPKQEPPISISNVKSEKSVLHVFPNPARDELIIENGELEIKNVQIIDLMGRTFLLPSFGGVGGGYSINISHLPQGVYCIVSNGKKATFVKN